METKVINPIRVLHILHSMNRGGAENALMNYYRCIDKEKVQFDFLLTSPDKSDFEDEILSLGGKVFRVPLLTLKKPFPYIKRVKQFFLSHPEYKIVHSHTSSKSVIPLAIAKICHIPFRISHSHSSKSENGFSGLIRNSLKPLLKHTANIYFSCGEQAADWLYGNDFSNRVEIIRNVIVAEKFRFKPEIREQIRQQLGINDSTLVIGHVARFCDVKNHKFSIDILKSALSKHPNTLLLLVGDGPLRNEIEAYAKQCGVDDHVKMVGVVPNVYDYEQAMDAFILPSFYEGLPLSIIEAQVSGLPCFTTQGAVSSECSVTDLVSYLPLESGADLWAEEIIKSIGKERTDRFKEIQEEGYDAETASEVLQNRYLEMYV